MTALPEPARFEVGSATSHRDARVDPPPAKRPEIRSAVPRGSDPSAGGQTITTCRATRRRPNAPTGGPGLRMNARAAAARAGARCQSRVGRKPPLTLHGARGWRQRRCPVCKAAPGERCATPRGPAGSRYGSFRGQPPIAATLQWSVAERSLTLAGTRGTERFQERPSSMPSRPRSSMLWRRRSSAHRATRRATRRRGRSPRRRPLTREPAPARASDVGNRSPPAPVRRRATAQSAAGRPPPAPSSHTEPCRPVHTEPQRHLARHVARWAIVLHAAGFELVLRIEGYELAQFHSAGDANALELRDRA
jgi:hypothetical protein